MKSPNASPLLSTNSRTSMLSVVVIGLGNWGTSLHAALCSVDVPVAECVVRSVTRRRFRTVTMQNAVLDAPVLWLCVPDGAIAEVTRQLVKRRKQQDRDLSGQIVLHSSGVLTADILAPAAEAGARIAAVHPLMTFPTRKPMPLAGVPFAVESEPNLQRKLFALARLLGGEPFRICAENKILYHAAATLASPLLLSCLMAAQQTAELAGLPPRLAARSLGRMSAATIANYLAHGPRQSFSGPLARGDIGTIQLHLQALLAHPILAASYRALAWNAIECLPGPNKSEMLRLLTSESKPGKPAPRSRRGSR